MNSYKVKCDMLKLAMEQYAEEHIMVAFSGGVDSSLLLALACEGVVKTGRKVYAATLHTMLHPVAELENAKVVAEELGAVHIVIEVDELEEAGILNNPVDRCYRCKKCLFEKVLEKAKKLKVPYILEGTNEDDLHVYRPGIKAVHELGVKSPLAEAGMTKYEVRRLAAEYGVSSSNRPSTPCLATRFPYGTVLSYEKMKKVEKGESYLKDMGFYNVRIREHGDIARIEVDLKEIPVVIEQKQEIVSYLKGLGYRYVTIDLEGFRSGSMD